MPKALCIKMTTILGIVISLTFAAPTPIANSDLTWELVSGVLKVEGSGDMPDMIDEYGYFTAPWYSSSSVSRIEIGEGVTSISDGAFAGLNHATAAVIPSTVKSIGTFAFGWCGLEHLDIPEGVISIGYGAFQGCTLEDIHIPSTLTSIGETAFGWCTWLKEITVSAGSQSFVVDGGVLYNKDKTRLVQYPPQKDGDTYDIALTVTEINGAAFSNCINLKQINIPSGVTHIGEWAFTYSGITSVVVPDGVTKIETGVFSICEHLEEVTLSKNITFIGEDAFDYCLALTTLTLPESLKIIDMYAFYGCGLTQISIPNGVTEIGDYAFAYCGLTEVVIPNSVTSIGAVAFIGSDQLTTVVIGGGVTEIPPNCFENCSSLETIINRASEPQTVGMNAFFNVNISDCMTYVPEQSYEDYAYSWWGNFIVREMPFMLDDMVLGVGETVDVQYIYEYAGAATITWTSSNPAVAQVDAAGKITAKKKGAVIITATLAGEDFMDVSFVTVEKGTPIATKPSPTAVYGQTLTNATLPNGWSWENALTTSVGSVGKKNFPAKFTPSDTANYKTLTGVSIELTVNKANPVVTTPTATAKVGETLGDVNLPSGWVWMDETTSVGAVGEKTFPAKYTPTDQTNYNVLTNVNVTVTVEAATSVETVVQADNRGGIKLSPANIVSQSVTIAVEGGKQLKVVIYDNIGNVVYEKVEQGGKVVWDLTNAAGRFVANGGYLVIVEAKDAKGQTSMHKAKLGVKR
jgi:hypothetical protein